MNTAKNKQEEYSKSLVFKWTVSRARDTYGYNICTLRVDSEKVSACNGGGYDMEGTALAVWMEQEFKEELLQIKEEHYGLTFSDPDFDAGKVIIDNETISARERVGKSLGLERYQAFHRATSKLPTEKYTVPLLDGACGMSSMERVLNAMGYRLKWVGRKNRDYTGYTLERG
jgi:hypothetical protein